MRLRSEPFSPGYAPIEGGQISAPVSPDSADRDAELRDEAQRLQRAQREARPDSSEARRLGERLRQIDRERVALMRASLAAPPAQARTAAVTPASGRLAELGEERARLQRGLLDPSLGAETRRELLEDVRRIDRERLTLHLAERSPEPPATPPPPAAPAAPLALEVAPSAAAEKDPHASLPYPARRRAAYLEREQEARRAHTEALSAVIARTVGAVAPDAAAEVAAGEATRAQLQELDAPLPEAPTRTERQRRGVISRRGERARPGALPQSAKPPQRIPYNVDREEEAKRAAEASAARARRRDVVYFPAWVREAVRRCARSREDAARELGHVPVPQRAAIQSTARIYGGLDDIAGRNVIGLGIAIWYMAQRLGGRISGLPRAAWASLTVGRSGKHYHQSSLFHACHSTDRPIDEERRGIYGGRVGVGRNRGFLVALCASGLIRLIVPSTAGAPPWMIAPSGWAYVQVLVCELEGSSDDTS